MRALLTFLLLVVAAGALAPAADAQIIYGQPSSANTGLYFTHWKMKGLDTEATIDQWMLPINGFVPLGENLEGRFFVAAAKNTLTEPGAEHTLNGLTDMRLQVNHSFSRDRYLLSLGLNLPTGKTGLNLDSEWLVMNVLTQNFLSFPIRRLGEGFGVNLLAGAATEWGEKKVGVSATYDYAGAYEAYEGEGSYDPGNSLLLNAGIQGDTDASVGWRGDLTYQTYADDQLEGKKVYSQGDSFGIHAGTILQRDGMQAAVDARYLIRGRNAVFDSTESLASRLKVYGNEFALGGKVTWVKESGLHYGPLAELRFIAGNEYGFGKSRILGLGLVAGHPLSRRLELNGGLKLYTGSTDDGDIDLSGYQFYLSLSGFL